MNKKEQNIQGRRAFEALVAKNNPTLDLHWDREKHKYSNLFTQQQWKGFMLCFENMNNEHGKSDKTQQQKSGFCIIGRYAEKGITISQNPVTHQNFKKAFTEARRLSDAHPGERFVILQSVVSVNGGGEQSKATPENTTKVTATE